MPSIADYEQRDNPYRSSVAPLMEDAQDFTGAVQEIELRAFVGRKKADYYLRKWAPRLYDPSGECGMNWAAFFLTGFWFAYRKMYLATIVLYAASVVLTILEHVLFIAVLGGKAVPPGVGLIVTAMVSIVCGLYANAWYLAHARNAIATARAKGLQDEHLLYELSRRGGTSLLASLGLFFVACLLISIVTFFLAIVAIGMPHAR